LATITPSSVADPSRRLFMILSPCSLPYARLCISSLFVKSAEHLDVCFMTDSSEDKENLEQILLQLPNPCNHRWWVVDDSETELRSLESWEKFPNLQRFRRGHPCWRKVTDPLLFTCDSKEMVVLDPDVYFPNRFAFEPTPEAGVLLMWQQPNCMLPPETVRLAMKASIRLAQHVDIGVAAWRAGPDLAWLDWAIGRLGGSQIPRVMHVESIVWSALAMRLGGGHLDPERWHCWRRSQVKRLLLKTGASGLMLLRSEPFHEMKCFHAGGEAKWWLQAVHKAGLLDCCNDLRLKSVTRAFAELTRRRFEFEQRTKTVLRSLGYYAVFAPSG
jgi:hypothetical protein